MPTIEEYSTDPYKALGLTPIINATCHHTRVGGTLIRDEVLDAMRAAAAHHVDMNRLQKAAGEVIARHTHAEARRRGPRFEAASGDLLTHGGRPASGSGDPKSSGSLRKGGLRDPRLLRYYTSRS